MGDIIEEELIDLPKVWVDLLNSMPDIKEVFISDKKVNSREMIPPYFFSYFIEDYKNCEPFFLCFERGKEVFDNLYELYGKNESEELADKNITETELKELITKHINGMNYLLAMKGETIYDIHKMKIEELTEQDFDDKYDAEDIEDAFIRRRCSQIIRHNILPAHQENPIVEFEEALYELTQNSYLIQYILWPLGKVVDVGNPYKAYVELWKRGIEPYIIDEDLLVVVR